MFRSFPGPKTTRGNEKITIDPPENSRVETISPNWCDKTTWYYNSVQVEDEELTDSGDHTIYNPAISRTWIDVTHGRLTQEHRIRAIYAPIVKVNSVTKTENSPESSDGDYSIDYDTGAVIFNEALIGTETVEASYYYENGSEWIVAPTSGKVLRLTQVELQFSTDAIINDSILFQLYVAGYPYGSPTVYQTMQDYINEASLAYPTIPAMGGESWRGLPVPIHIFRWPYAERGATDLKSSFGMQIHIKLENDIPMGGHVAIATFYGVSEDE